MKKFLSFTLLGLIMASCNKDEDPITTQPLSLEITLQADMPTASGKERHHSQDGLISNGYTIELTDEFSVQTMEDVDLSTTESINFENVEGAYSIKAYHPADTAMMAVNYYLKGELEVAEGKKSEALTLNLNNTDVAYIAVENSLNEVRGAQLNGFEMAANGENAKYGYYAYVIKDFAYQLSLKTRNGKLLSETSPEQAVRYRFEVIQDAITEYIHDKFPEPVFEGEINVIDDLYNLNGNGQTLNTTAYYLDTLISPELYAGIIFADDVDYVNVYAYSNGEKVRHDFMDVAGKSLKTVLAENNITELNLRHDYKEWFAYNGSPRLVSLNIKAVKELEKTPIHITPNLNGFDANGAALSNTAYLARQDVDAALFETTIVDSDVAFLNIYTRDENGEKLRLDIEDAAGKSLKQIMDENNIALEDLRTDYVEWFTNAIGNKTLVNLNFKAVKYVGSSNLVIKEGLFNSDMNKVELSNTAYMARIDVDTEQLENTVIGQDVDFVNIYALNGNGEKVRFDIMDAAGKSLMSILEENEIALSDLRTDYQEWFTNAKGRKTMVTLNIKAVTYAPSSEIEINEDLISTNELGNVYSNTSYLMHSAVTEEQLAEIIIGEDVDFVNIYYKNRVGLRKRADIENAAGKSLLEIMNGAKIKLEDVLVRNYHEIFVKDGKPVRVALDIKAVKQLK